MQIIVGLYQLWQPSVAAATSVLSICLLCIYFSFEKKNISSVTKWLAAYIFGKRLLLLMAQSNNDNNTTEEQHTPAIVSAYTPVAGWTTWISNEAHQHPADHLTWINPLKINRNKNEIIYFSFAQKGCVKKRKKRKEFVFHFQLGSSQLAASICCCCLAA